MKAQLNPITNKMMIVDIEQHEAQAIVTALKQYGDHGIECAQQLLGAYLKTSDKALLQTVGYINEKVTPIIETANELSKLIKP